MRSWWCFVHRIRRLPWLRCQPPMRFVRLREIRMTPLRKTDRHGEMGFDGGRGGGGDLGGGQRIGEGGDVSWMPFLEPQKSGLRGPLFPALVSRELAKRHHVHRVLAYFHLALLTASHSFTRSLTRISCQSFDCLASAMNYP